MEKAPKLYFVGMLTAILKDVKGNDYITALCHNGNVDEDGCIVEPHVGQMIVNSSINPTIYAHVLSGRGDKDTAIKVRDNDAVMFAVVPKPTRGLVSRLQMDEFYLVDANGARRVNDQGEERTGKFITTAVLGNTKDEVDAATVKQYEQRFEYYTEQGLFVDGADANEVKKPAVSTLIDAE